jgi:peptidoglycan hydrolase-like protein with peptidoglycan-binding domain
MAPVVRPVLAPAPATTARPPARTPAPHPPGLGFGDSGPAVLAMEQRLAALHYDVGTPDGHFGPADTYAVTAFQKVHGLARTGWASPAVLSSLVSSSDPAPLVPGGGATRVEIDLARQVLFLFEGDALVRILPVSTGSGQRYCVDGQCDVAVTPGGSFRVFRKKLGVDVSKLGVLYNPLYFNGGIAIHGEPADPPYPASHGCVRIPMNSSLWFYDQVPFGTPVYVLGGPHVPPPFHAEPPSPSPSPPLPPKPVTPAPTVPAPTVPAPTVPPSTVTTPPRPPTTLPPAPQPTTTTVTPPSTTPTSTTVAR